MAFVKSVFWLVGCGGFSYILLEAITPKDSELRKSLPEGQVHHRPELNQQPTFFEALRKIANEKKFETPSSPKAVEK